MAALHCSSLPIAIDSSTVMAVVLLLLVRFECHTVMIYLLIEFAFQLSLSGVAVLLVVVVVVVVVSVTCASNLPLAAELSISRLYHFFC